MYWVDTMACYGGDQKSRRPVVIVRAPNPPMLTDAIVVARSTKEKVPGAFVDHEPNRALDLDKPGRFVKFHRKHIDARFFDLPAYTQYHGQLDEDTLQKVLIMMGLA